MFAVEIPRDFQSLSSTTRKRIGILPETGRTIDCFVWLSFSLGENETCSFDVRVESACNRWTLIKRLPLFYRFFFGYVYYKQ